MSTQTVNTDVHVSGAERHVVLLTGFAEAAFVTLLPVIAVWLFDISIIDQDGYVDPEFYTGYGLSFERMWNVHGLTYYAARFPVMFLNTATQQLVPGFGGYALAHYLVFLAAAIPLYLLARREYGRTIAIASCAFLVANPLFPRVINWDLTIFVSIPAGLAGIALWLLAKRPYGIAAFAAGFMFATALNSHVFTGTAIAVFLATECLFAVFHRRGLLSFVIRGLTASAGAATCMLLGLWFYATTVGGVPAEALFEVTINAVRVGRGYAETNYVALASYYATNYEIYVPLVTVAAAVVLSGKRLLSDTADARIAWFAVAYLGAYTGAVFVLRMNIVQYFWYFGHLTIAIYLIVPVILRRLMDRAGQQPVFWFIGILTVVSLAVNLAFPTMQQLSNSAWRNGAVAFGILGFGALAVALLGFRQRLAVTAGAILCAIVVQAPFLSATHLSVYDSTQNAPERPLFEIIRSYHRLLNAYDNPDSRVRTWYQTGNPHLGSIASSNLLFTLQNPWTGPGMPHLGDAERRVLIMGVTRYVLLIADEPTRVEAGLQALRDAKVEFVARRRERWGYAPMQMSATLIELAK